MHAVNRIGFHFISFGEIDKLAFSYLCAPPHTLKYRLDDIVIFSPLSRKQLRSIMQLQMAAISNRLKDRNIEIHLAEDGLDHVLAKAYVPEVCSDITSSFCSGLKNPCVPHIYLTYSVFS